MKKKKAVPFARTLGICVSTAAAAALLSGCGPFGPAPALYGPPPVTPTQAQEDADIPETVYGPPSFFDEEFAPPENVPEDVYGPPLPEEDDFSPAGEIAEPMYGPPAGASLPDGEEPDA